MAVAFAVVAAAALWISLRGMFERASYQDAEPLPLLSALKETLVNRSFVSLVTAQTLRFVGTFTLTKGMAFYTKYSLGLEEGQTSTIFATVFVAAMPALWLWRSIARRVGPRTTLMLAYGVFGLSALPLAVVQSLWQAMLAGVLIGIGLAGMLLMGDVILCDVIDEDELRTGRRREGMYFGMSGFIITLSDALAALVFGWIAAAYGYNSALGVQPATAGTGFRVYMTAPTVAGGMLAILALAFYPLHGAYLAQVKEKLAARQGQP
jgi:GPH family glycoside/pentoside/hexuronide:cation symporter